MKIGGEKEGKGSIFLDKPQFRSSTVLPDSFNQIIVSVFVTCQTIHYCKYKELVMNSTNLK